jgi:hypothetical protein
MSSIQNLLRNVKESSTQTNRIVDGLNSEKPELQELISASNLASQTLRDLNRLIGLRMANPGD